MLRSLAWRAARATDVGAIWLCYRAEPLHADGWVRSMQEGRCVDRQGKPLPWLTYPAIEFLARRVRSDLSVFEYGCGMGTLWWAARTQRVVAVEHDPVWAAKISAEAPAHAAVLQRSLEPDDAYVSCPRGQGPPFDVVLIDGANRVRCVPHAIAALGPRGVIVFDNTDRAEYAPGLSELEQAGFRSVPFVGLAPMGTVKTETSVWYRAGNCLGL